MLARMDDNREIARAWLAAFNGRDVDALVGLYADDAVHTSPKLRARHPETDGKVTGKLALRAWWKDAFERLPSIRYEATSITADDARVFVEYVRHVPNETDLGVAEVFDVRAGKIVASRVYHG
jgi:ketosteroid isomerase-like protein